MDENDLLGVRATFDRVALAIERDGLTSENVERIMGWGTLTLARTLVRANGGEERPYANVAVRSWRQYGVTGGAPGDHIAPLVVKVLRELSYRSKAEMHGFERERLDCAGEIAREPHRYANDVLESASKTLKTAVRMGNESDRAYAREHLDTLNELEDRHARN